MVRLQSAGMPLAVRDMVERGGRVHIYIMDVESDFHHPSAKSEEHLAVGRDGTWK